ncbi:MAG: hypothetical protein IKW62_03325 [Clostridia bacterium]|nr:hypothetical protein [Clostridia bacterium]
MNIQEMLSKMNSEMLSQGLKQISQGLTPEQIKQAENAIKSSNLAKDLGNVDLKTLQQNPQKLKEIVQNKELISQLETIVKKK